MVEASTSSRSVRYWLKRAALFALSTPFGRTRRTMLLRQSGLFDQAWYLANNPDVAASGMDPLAHYVLHGASEGRSPSAQFPASTYHLVHPEVYRSGNNPLLHLLVVRDGKLPDSAEIDTAIDRALSESPPKRSLKSWLPVALLRKRGYWAYDCWTERYEGLDHAGRARIADAAAAMPIRPRISVVMPVYQTDLRYLEEAIQSVRHQLYEDWELCIADDASPSRAVRDLLDKHAREDARIKVAFRSVNGHISACSNSALDLVETNWIALFDHDDLLRPDALYHVAKAIVANPRAGVLYSDEDKILFGRTRANPYFKSEFDPLLMRFHNMISHLGVYRLDLVRAAGGFRTGYEGSQDHDLALRCLELVTSEQVVHIPHVLYHWRIHEKSTASTPTAKPYALNAGVRALQEHLTRIGSMGHVDMEPATSTYRVSYRLRGHAAPLVSIVIDLRSADRKHVDRLTHLVRVTQHPACELLLLVPPATGIAGLLAQVKDRGFSVVEVDEPRHAGFSPSRNKAAARATGSLICFLDHQLEVVEPDWLSELAGLASESWIGAVGAHLVDPEDRLTSAGILVDTDGRPRALFDGMKAAGSGYFGRKQATQCFRALPATCVIVRLDTLRNCGGFDESLGPQSAAVDFCLRLGERGLRNAWLTTARLRYHTSVEPPAAECHGTFENEIMAKWGGGRLGPDPGYSPNMDLDPPRLRPAWPPRTVPERACTRGVGR